MAAGCRDLPALRGCAVTNILLCLSHAIEEYDQLRLFHGLGYGVFSIGGYIDPAHPHADSRPALPELPHHAELHAAVDALNSPDNLGAAQSDIPEAVLDWLGDDGVIIYHHNLHRLFGQWPRLSAWRKGAPGRRIIWRTVGQSVASNEAEAAPFRADGLEIVRYSPKEANIPGYLGADALIRFYKDPAEWGGWTGEDPTVIQFVQNFGARWEWCNRPFFEQATAGLQFAAYGPQSDELPYGRGPLSPDAQRARLRSARAYLYTGTQPASYTLGLIEAMMTGIPVLTIGPEHMQIFRPYGPDLFEAPELLRQNPGTAEVARDILRLILNDRELALSMSTSQRRQAIRDFGIDTIAPQWKAFLG